MEPASLVVVLTSPLLVPFDVSIGDDLAFANEPLDDLTDEAVQLLIRVSVQVVVHVGLAL